MLKRVIVVQFHACYELENFAKDCVLVFRESEGFEFFHKRILPKKHPTWDALLRNEIIVYQKIPAGEQLRHWHTNSL